MSESEETSGVSQPSEDGGGRAGVGPSAPPSPAKVAYADFLRGGYGAKAEAALLHYGEAKGIEVDALKARVRELEAENGLLRALREHCRELEAAIGRHREETEAHPAGSVEVDRRLYSALSESEGDYFCEKCGKIHARCRCGLPEGDAE